MCALSLIILGWSIWVSPRMCVPVFPLKSSSVLTFAMETIQDDQSPLSDLLEAASPLALIILGCLVSLTPPPALHPPPCPTASWQILYCLTTASTTLVITNALLLQRLRQAPHPISSFTYFILACHVQTMLVPSLLLAFLLSLHHYVLTALSSFALLP
jgi:hypothetical protein